jgi:RNA polymerase sigma factor (sigma-70 family)
MDDEAHDHTCLFNQLRPRLQKIAYRMMGSVAEAEDIVQDVWLRWHAAARERIDNAEAWLVAVATRLSIDRLRAAKVQREHYAGIWLPEPEFSEAPATPEQLKERADDVSVAFLLLLERLSPEARAAFLLREVFDADYDEVAAAIGKSEAACRQLVSRAKQQLRDERPRHTVPREIHRRLLQSFANALDRGDFHAIHALLAEDAMLMGDGGGRVPSFPLRQPASHRTRRAQRFAGAAAHHRRRGRIGAVRRNRRQPHRALARAAQSRQARAHRRRAARGLIPHGQHREPACRSTVARCAILR